MKSHYGYLKRYYENLKEKKDLGCERENFTYILYIYYLCIVYSTYLSNNTE